MKNEKLIKLEAIRGFAAVYVVFHHLFSEGLNIGGINFSFLFKFGQEAVILFFILSGFVIQYSYDLAKDKSFKLFFLKRFLRIYIPLVLVFATNYFLKSLTGSVFAKMDWWNLLGNILMLQDISSLKPNVLFDPFLGNGPLWSLSYEWWFYMIFFFVYKQLGDKASGVIYLTGILAAITYIPYPNFINRELMYLVIWWMGADLARIYSAKKEFTIRNLRLSLAAVFLCTLILLGNIYFAGKLNLSRLGGTIGVHPWLEFRHFAFALTALLIALLWRKINWFGFSFSIGLFTPLASISFGIYISHWFLFVNATYLDNLIANDILRYSIYGVLCIAFSYLIERVLYVRWSRRIMSVFYKK